MPSKRKASDTGDGSPSKRAALTSTNPRGRDTPTRQPAPAATPKVRKTYGKQKQDTENATPKPKSQVESDAKPETELPAPSPAKARGHQRRKQVDVEGSPSKRRSKRMKGDQEVDLVPVETPRRKKWKTNIVVEVPPPSRPAPVSSLLPPPRQSSPPRVESHDAPATPLKPRVIRPSKSPSKSQHSLLSSKQLPSQFHPCLNAQKRVVLRSLHGLASFADVEEEISAEKTAKKQLLDLLDGTISRSEGNSCLLLGPRGSGKSSMLDDCIKSLSQTPIIVRLSGWIHQTDRLAMREIAYQLGQQTGKTFLQASEAEIDDSIEQDYNPFLDRPDSAEVAEIGLGVPPSSHLPALISVIPTLSRPTIVILDAFDLFALHPRQALLYCLLDTVQGCRASMNHKGFVVIGTTTRIDTINLLEKRVKSRFSGRVIHTIGVHTTQRWLSLTKKVLCSELPPVDDDELVDEWNDAWKKRISMFLDEKEVVEMIKDTVGLAKDPRLLSRILTFAIARLSPSSPFPTFLSLAHAVLSQRSRPSLYDSLDLPYPALCLLVASIHSVTSGHEVFTFEMLFSTFRNQLRASVAAPVQVNGGSIGMLRCTRAVLLSAFEHLIDCRIFAPAASLGVMAKEFVRYRMTLEREDIRKVIEKTGQIALKKWLNKAE